MHVTSITYVFKIPMTPFLFSTNSGLILSLSSRPGSHSHKSSCPATQLRACTVPLITPPWGWTIARVTLCMCNCTNENEKTMTYKPLIYQGQTASNHGSLFPQLVRHWSCPGGASANTCRVDKFAHSFFLLFTNRIKMCVGYSPFTNLAWLLNCTDVLVTLKPFPSSPL